LEEIKKMSRSNAINASKLIDRKSYILRSRGYNPAWHFAKFSDLLSYGTAWGEGADTVVTRMRQRKKTKETFARVLLKPGDWPIQKE
jgi:hypothetical protein